MTPKRLSARTLAVAVLAACAFMQGALAQAPQPTDNELYAKAKQEGTVVWYSGAPAGSGQMIAQKFMEAYPGVSVEVVRLANVQQYQRFNQESISGQNIADVVSMDITSIQALDQAGYLAHWKVPANDDVMPEARYKDVSYSPLLVDAVIAYNPRKVTPEEAKMLGGDWTAILDPRFKGRFAVTDQKCSVCYLMIHMFMDPKLSSKYGLPFLQKMAAQQPRIYPEINVALDRVIAGERDFLVSTFENAAAAKWGDGAPIRWVHPSPSPIAVVSGWQSVAAHAPHPNAARLFQDWWIGPKGAAVEQQYYGGPSTIHTSGDNRPFLHEPWYEPITDPYSIDIDRWSKNFDSDMDLFVKTMRSGR